MYDAHKKCVIAKHRLSTDVKLFTGIIYCKNNPVYATINLCIFYKSQKGKDYE